MQSAPNRVIPEHAPDSCLWPHHSDLPVFPMKPVCGSLYTTEMAVWSWMSIFSFKTVLVRDPYDPNGSYFSSLKNRVSKDLKRCDRQCRLANSPCPLPWPVLTNASGKASYSFPWLRSTDTAPGHSHGKKLWAKRWKSKTVKMTSKKLFAALIKCLFSLASCLEWRCDARSSGSLLVIMRAK